MNYFQDYLVSEFAEDYQEGHISRRDALKLIASVTGSLLLANSILAGCAPIDQTTAPVDAESTLEPTQPSPARTASSTSTPRPAETTSQPESPAYGTVGPDDPAIQTADIQFPSDGAAIFATLAQPAGEGPFPVVLVCHENRGLTEHIKDVARRLAKAGYVALAIDLLSRQGGSSVLGSEAAPGALGNTSPDQFVRDFLAGYRYLQSQPFANTSRVGMVGFCFGGGVTWLMATRMPELGAAVPFYGPHPPLEDVPNIQAAVLGIYGERDQRINQGIPEIEQAMQQNNKVFEKIIYPNADHAFHNDTGTRYNPEAAKDAWTRTLDWFGRYINQP